MALVLWPGLLIAGLLTAVLFRVHVDHSDVKESTGSCNWKIQERVFMVQPKLSEVTVYLLRTGWPRLLPGESHE